MRFLPHRPIKGAVWGVQQLSARASLTVLPPSTSPPTLSMGFREFRDLLFCGMCIYDLYWIFLLLRLLLLLSFSFSTCNLFSQCLRYAVSDLAGTADFPPVSTPTTLTSDKFCLAFQREILSSLLWAQTGETRNSFNFFGLTFIIFIFFSPRRIYRFFFCSNSLHSWCTLQVLNFSRTGCSIFYQTQLTAFSLFYAKHKFNCFYITTFFWKCFCCYSILLTKNEKVINFVLSWIR